MSNRDRMILVSGITGQQGGAVARHLLAKGWQVRGLSRDLNKPAVKALQDSGVEMAQGDMEDRASLDEALKWVYGVFSVQNFWLPGVGAEGEIRQGIALADAAKAAHVQHFVYTSVGGAERNTGIPHFESKWQIEQHIRTLGLPATIVRPVAFMDNYNWSRPMILNGTFQGFGLRDDKPLQIIAADDIGGIVAAIFDNPQTYIGKALEIAGDELTEPEIAAVFSKVIGRPVQRNTQSWNAAGSEPDPEQVKMVNWFNNEGYAADIPATRAIYPPLMNLETWLRKTGWENAEPVPMTSTTWGQPA